MSEALSARVVEVSPQPPPHMFGCLMCPCVTCIDPSNAAGTYREAGWWPTLCRNVSGGAGACHLTYQKTGRDE